MRNPFLQSYAKPRMVTISQGSTVYDVRQGGEVVWVMLSGLLKMILN